MAPVGRSKKKKGNKHLVHSKKSVNNASSKPEDLLQRAESFLEACEFLKAEKLLEKVVEHSDADAAALEKAGVLLLELGNPAAARKGLLSAAQLSPDVGHLKYLYLSQLSEGKDALVFLNQAVHILKDGNCKDADTARALSSSHCSVCELFMTDLCDEEDAESQCEAALQAALEACPLNPEVLQMRAGLRLVQQRQEDARADVLSSLELWLPKLKQASASSSHMELPEMTGLTSEQRIKCAEILVELDELDKCLDVLDYLMEEDDENPQVWYLFGLVYHRQGGDALPAAHMHLLRAKEMLQKLGDTDSPAVQEIEEILEQIGDVDDDQEMPSEDCDDFSSCSSDDEVS